MAGQHVFPPVADTLLLQFKSIAKNRVDLASPQASLANLLHCLMEPATSLTGRLSLNPGETFIRIAAFFIYTFHA